jgi:hemerythrin-like domain-containing protein
VGIERSRFIGNTRKEAEMGPLEDLRAEHEGILLMLRILERVCARLVPGGRLDMTHLDKIMEFFVVFVDKCHHGKEEEFLFPALEETGVPREGGPIGVMLREHAAGRTYVSQMRQTLTGYKAGNPGAGEGFQQHARQYTELLRQHIDKENNVLFVMAESRLPRAKEKELGRAFEKLEKERIGEGRHEEFHALLDQLQREYLR